MIRLSYIEMEKKTMKHKEQILLLDLLEILKKHTDAKNTLKQQEIIQILKQEYGYEKLQRKTVKNNLDKLRNYADIVRATDLNYSDVFDEEKQQRLSNYYYNHEFNESELRLIIDSILFSKNMTSKEKKIIIEKLEHLTSRHFNSRKNNISIDENAIVAKPELFPNVQILDEAITAGKKVEFEYKRYVMNNYRIRFEAEKNADGTPRKYVINPYHMVISNGHYYLICNNDRYDNLSHYRIDRIANMQILHEQDRKPANKMKGLEGGRSVADYVKEHMYMFAGETVNASIRFEKRLLSEFIDWFGMKDIHFSNQTETEVTASLKLNRNALRRWALQYGLYFKVIEPEELVAQIKQDIEQVRKNYFDM